MPPPTASPRAAWTRRRALSLSAGVLPASLAACGWFQSKPKAPLPGKREDVVASEHALVVPAGTKPHVVLPPAVANAAWPQPGGNPTHTMGHLQTGQVLSPLWQAKIGAGGGFRDRITAQPVVADGRVFTMDSDGGVRAFATDTGRLLWQHDTKAKGDRSANVGGGLAIAGGIVFAATGRGQMVAFDAAQGTERWRQDLGSPARSAPTVADGRVFVSSLQPSLLAMASADGKPLWDRPATAAETAVLGDPAPAYANGLVIGGFGSGDLLALRAETGSVAWSDSLTAAGGNGFLANISAITGMPVVGGEQVYVIGQGNLMLSIDVHTGRRLWQRDVSGSQTPWLAGEWLFILTLDQRAAAVSTRDGQAAWITELPHYKNTKNKKKPPSNPFAWFGPILVSDRLIFAGAGRPGGPGGAAIALSPYTGEVLGQQNFHAAAAVAPVVAGGVVYFVTDDGALLAFR